MAKAKIETVDALRRAAKKIEAGAPYMWGHMGSCNCGNLAQEITQLSKGQIHAYAMQGRGDWNEQLNDYCSVSAMPIDLLIHEMLMYGFELSDLQNLEKLAEKAVLARIDVNLLPLKHNNRTDVVLYMFEWAAMLEEELIKDVKLPAFLADATTLELVNA
jgi:hypothetical protein